MAYALQPISVTAATLTLSPESHGQGVVVVNRAAGSTLTLPAAVGGGDKYTVVVGTTVTSNSVIIEVANADDTMAGLVSLATTALGPHTKQAAGGTDDTITMNGTTTGGIVGSTVELIDYAENVWLIDGRLVGSGTLATPLSAAVS